MTTRTDMMLSLMLPPANVHFEAPTVRDDVPCVFGSAPDIWAYLLGPAEALSAATVSIALSSPLARGTHSSAVVGPVFTTVWPDDYAPVLGWYVRAVLELLTPRQALVELTYDARPVRLVCDRKEQRLNLLIRLSDD